MSLVKRPAASASVRAIITVGTPATSVASATLDWTITNLGSSVSGSVPMRFLGGLLYRADFAPPAGLISNGATVDFTLTATDRRGNSTTTPPQTFSLCGVQSYGLGLGGGNSSLLEGSGSTSLGNWTQIDWSNSGPSSTGVIALALAPAFVVLPPGTVLIDGNQLIEVAPILSDATGAGSLPIPIPPLPFLVGLRVDIQCLFDTPVTLTNGVDLVICP